MDFNEAMELWFESLSRESLYTALPAVVTAVTDFNGKQVVDVKPTIKRKYEDGTAEDTAPIFNVPVVFPAGGGGLFSFPMAVGDKVLLIFSMRDLDNWSIGDGSGATDAESARSHSNTDAIAIPGLFPGASNLSPSATDCELKFKDQSVRLEAGGNTVLSPATGKSLTLKPDGEVLHHSGAKITDAGDFVTASGKSLNTHLHVGSPTAATGPVSNTGIPV